MTTCVKIHQIPYVVFGTIGHFLWHNSSVLSKPKCYIYFWQIYLIKYKFSDLSPPELIFIKFLMSFFKQEMSFSSKFGSLFTIMRDNSSVLFSWNFKCYWQKWHIKVHIFRLATARIKIYEILQTLHHSPMSSEITCCFFFCFFVFFLGGGVV